MKHLTQLLASIVFVFAVFACKEAGDQVSAARGNSHDNARTATYTDLSGTVTLPAGTYDEIRIANGSNVTLANGVIFKNFNWGLYTIGGAGITITIPSGAVVTAQAQSLHIIQSGVTVNNSGKFKCVKSGPFGDGRILSYGNFNNFGTHECDEGLLIGGTYTQKTFSNLTAPAVVQYPYTSGRLNLDACSTTSVKEIATSNNPAPFLYGKGKINITSTTVASIIRASVLTGDANVKVCAALPLSYADGGSFGTGQQTCSGGCL